MEQKKIDLCNGALLHDIGKLIYRHNDQRRHQETGYEFLKEANMNKAVLDQVRYHHAAQLKSASLSKDNLAYITYYADNISAGIDRRKQEDGAYGFDRHAKLDSIFNICLLSGSHKRHPGLDAKETNESGRRRSNQL